MTEENKASTRDVTGLNWHNVHVRAQRGGFHIWILQNNTGTILSQHFPIKNTWHSLPIKSIWRLFFLVSLRGVRLSPLGTLATVGLLYQPWMIDDDYGALGEMRIGRGNRSTRRKPAPVPLCPPQIPHDLTWDRTQAATVGSWRLTAWAMAWPIWRLTLIGLI
jgi:hypothetical protein